MDEIIDSLLLTVTYGTACAPYLAICCLLFLAKKYGNRFPRAALILKLLSYVDDCFGGADSSEVALDARNQLIQILECAQISLSKWSANQVELLQGLHTDGESEVSVEIDNVVSTLGLKWAPASDDFFFRVETPSPPPKTTKRSILSDVSKLFDPLGWLSPFLVQCKTLLQSLWLHKFDWDDPLEGDILSRWLALRAQMPLLSTIRIPRWFGVSASTKWTLHGFGDASREAYSAAVYLVIPGASSCLLMAKNKVAPIKTLSILRLELCATVLLVHLIHYLQSQLQHLPISIFCWTDSKVTLDWISSPPARWHTFVANRVSEIITTLPNAKWSHVPTSQNPADLAPRGVMVEELKSSVLWWYVPEWVSKEESHWPLQRNLEPETSLEVRTHAVFQEKQSTHVLDTLEKFSSFSKIICIVAYIFLWRSNAQRLRNEGRRLVLNRAEVQAARFAIFKVIQCHHFQVEVMCLSSCEKLPRKSTLRHLSPSICPQGLLRVGERLRNSSLSYGEKHPIILSRHSFFVLKMLEELHRDTLHEGTSLMLSELFRWAWIPRVTRLVQGIFRNCHKCVRFAARTMSQQMAPLPSVRLTPRMAFEAVGVDYAGPISTLFSRGRRAKSTEGYFAIFIYMLTRAIHIEVVSDLTTAAFIAAFRRFVSRRGRCTDVYSDNGRNFTRAFRELEHQFDQASTFSKEVAAKLAQDQGAWHFSPPRSPHFGGLWEAAVKSFKHHLKRVVGDSILTFEEFSTLTTQIKACLNSRPISPLSSEGTDLVALTPEHFLIGRSLSAVPEPFNDTDLTNSSRCRWRLIQRMRNNFWDRWRKEVLHHYQQRGKWLDVQDQLELGDVVLIKDELTPPTECPLAQVTALHPGKDGLIRVVELRTATSSFTRALDEFIKLPANPDAEAQSSSQQRSGVPEEND